MAWQNILGYWVPLKTLFDQPRAHVLEGCKELRLTLETAVEKVEKD